MYGVSVCVASDITGFTPEVGCESSSLYIACEILIKLKDYLKVCSKTSLQQPDRCMIVSPSVASIARIDC